MSETEIKRYIKDLSNRNKKKRQSACESLKVRCLVLDRDDTALLQEALSALNKTKSDKDKNVRKSAESAYSTIINHLNSLQTTQEPEKVDLKGEAQPALEYIIDEILNGTLTTNGELDPKSIKTKGHLKIKNLSQSERIFDINFNLEEKGLASLEEEAFHLNELMSEEEETIEYKIKIKKLDDVAVAFQESIDTSPDTEEASNVLVFGQEMATQINYNFTAKKNLATFKLTKELPSGFEDVAIMESSIGKASIEENSVIWTFDNVKEGTTGKLVISGIFKVTNLDDISTGKATVEFSSLTDTHSGLKLSDNFEGRVKSRYFVESNEITEEPDHWLNKFVFENASDVDILLHRINMTDPNSEDPESPVVSLNDEDNPVLVSAGRSWESEEFKSFSESIPSFNNDIDFKVGSSTKISSISQLVVAPGILQVANITATKVFKADVVPSFRESTVPAEVIIENIGAMPYSSLVITDKIPQHFLPPLMQDMKLTLITTDGEEDILNPDADYEYSVSEDADNPDNPDVEKTITISVTRVINTGEKLQWNFAHRAHKPVPDQRYDFHTKLEAQLTENAPPLVFEMPEDLVLKVLHKRRNVTIGKTISPGTNKDEYEVEMFYKNRGTATLSQLSIKDFIPEQFTFQSESVDFKTTDEEGNQLNLTDITGSEADLPEEFDGEGVLRVWEFETVKPGDVIVIKYVIIGEGEYSLKQAQMTLT